MAASSSIYFVWSLFSLLSVAKGAKYMYDAGLSTCQGTTSDPCGPDYWYKTPGYEACRNIDGVSKQTPIDFSNIELDEELENPEFEVEHGGCDSWLSGSNDHAYEVGFHEEGCHHLKVVYEQETYTFLQFHFHSPSEHTLGGAHFSAEAHMVHRSDSGKLLVIGVFLQETVSTFTMPNNTFLDAVWGGRTIEEISQNHTYHGEPMNPYKHFTPGSLQTFVYEGSLTTPPCFEDVQWLVYTEPVSISSDDTRILRGATAAFKWGTALSSAGNDNRPVQPLNGREVRMSTGAGGAHEHTDDSDDKYPGRSGMIIGAIALALVIVVIVLLVYIVMKFYTKEIIAVDKNKPASDHEFEMTHTSKAHQTHGDVHNLQVHTDATNTV